MRPDVKYMPRDKTDLVFETFEPRLNLSSTPNGWKPIVNYDNSTNETRESIFKPSVVIKPYNLGSQMTTSIPNNNNNNITFIPPGGLPSNPNQPPSETNKNELFSYNKNREIREDYSSIEPSDVNLLITDILREISYQYDDFSDDNFQRNDSNNKIQDILKLIESDYSFILTTLKAYRVPLVVSKILIKKIISISLENCNKE